MQGHSNTVVRVNTLCARSLLVACALVACGLLSGCGLLQKVGILSAPSEPAIVAPAPVPLADQPYELNLTLSVSESVNPDSQARPSPIQVRIFLTEQASEISARSFEEIFDINGNAVEPRPLATVTLRPGQVKELTLSANKTQTLLAIAGAFRDPYQSVWIAAANVTPQDKVSASASLSAQRVTINPSR